MTDGILQFAETTKKGECQEGQDCQYLHVGGGGNPYATESPEERGRSPQRTRKNKKKKDDADENEEDEKKKNNKKDKTSKET